MHYLGEREMRPRNEFEENIDREPEGNQRNLFEK